MQQENTGFLTLRLSKHDLHVNKLRENLHNFNLAVSKSKK